MTLQASSRDRHFCRSPKTATRDNYKEHHCSSGSSSEPLSLHSDRTGTFPSLGVEHMEEGPDKQRSRQSRSEELQRRPSLLRSSNGERNAVQSNSTEGRKDTSSPNAGWKDRRSPIDGTSPTHSPPSVGCRGLSDASVTQAVTTQANDEFLKIKYGQELVPGVPTEKLQKLQQLVPLIANECTGDQFFMEQILELIPGISESYTRFHVIHSSPPKERRMDSSHNSPVATVTEGSSDVLRGRSMAPSREGRRESSHNTVTLVTLQNEYLPTGEELGTVIELLPRIPEEKLHELQHELLPWIASEYTGDQILTDKFEEPILGISDACTRDLIIWSSPPPERGRESSRDLPVATQTGSHVLKGRRMAPSREWRRESSSDQGMASSSFSNHLCSHHSPTNSSRDYHENDCSDSGSCSKLMKGDSDQANISTHPRLEFREEADKKILPGSWSPELETRPSQKSRSPERRSPKVRRRTRSPCGEQKDRRNVVALNSPIRSLPYWEGLRESSHDPVTQLTSQNESLPTLEELGTMIESLPWIPKEKLHEIEQLLPRIPSEYTRDQVLLDKIEEPIPKISDAFIGDLISCSSPPRKRGRVSSHDLPDATQTEGSSYGLRGRRMAPSRAGRRESSPDQGMVSSSSSNHQCSHHSHKTASRDYHEGDCSSRSRSKFRSLKGILMEQTPLPITGWSAGKRRQARKSP